MQTRHYIRVYDKPGYDDRYTVVTPSGYTLGMNVYGQFYHAESTNELIGDTRQALGKLVAKGKTIEDLKVFNLPNGVINRIQERITSDPDYMVKDSLYK